MIAATFAALETFARALGVEVGPVRVNTIRPGFTDSHYLREAFGTTAYGFFPLRTMDTEVATKLVHSANERIPIDDLELGVHLFRHTAQELLGG